MKSTPSHRGFRPGRRGFLRALGGSAALLPLFESRFAQGAAVPRRLVLMNTTNGVLDDSFFPKGDGSNLADLTLPTCTAPLNDWKSKVIILGGLSLRNFLDYENHGAGHENFSCLFTGAKGHEVNDGGPRFVGGSPTLDQYVATELGKKAQLPVKCLSLGLVGGNYWHQSRCFYRGPNDPITPETDPAKAFATVFAGSGGMASPELDRLRAERRSILDFVGRDIESFGKRLGVEDRRKVEAHVTSIRELEGQLGKLGAPAGGAGCAPPTLPMVDASQVRTGKNVPQVLEAQMDLIVAAFKCDSTRVATIQMTTGNGANFMFEFIGLGGPGMEYKFRDHHDIAHRPGAGNADKNRVDRWFVEQLVALMKKLQAVPEGTGTMLDNTVILLANHMGNGGAHSSTNVPWIIGGNAGGYLKTGQYYRGNNTATTVVLKALAGAMEVDSSRFGDNKYGGELAALKA